MSDVSKTGQGASSTAASRPSRRVTSRERAAGKCFVPWLNASSYSVQRPSIFQSRLSAFPSKEEANRMEAELRARKSFPQGAKITWGVNFKTGKWEPSICDRACQDPARQAALLRNDTRRSKSSSSDSNWKRFGRAALFSLAWPVTVPAALLGACSGSPGKNNNNPTWLDGSVDASDATVTGDASVLDDGGVPFPYCIEEGREGIDDAYLKLLNPDNNGDCYALAMSHYDGMFNVLCAFPNNRLLQFEPGDLPELTQLGRVTDSAEAPENGEMAEVHPRSVLMFSPDGVKQLAVVPYQQVNSTDPGNVKGGLYVYDADGAQIQLVQDRGLSVRVISGGDPEGTVFTYTDPVGAVFSNGRVWVAPENLDPDTDESIVSDIVGSPVVDRGNGLWILDDEVSLGSPDDMGYRPTAVARVNDTLIAGVFNGKAANNDPDWKKPKFAIFDASSAQTFNDALLTVSDNIGLTHDWQFAALPNVAKTYDNRNFMLAAENPSTGRYKVISVHVDDLSDVANTSHSVSSDDIPAELPNPAYRDGTDDPVTVSTGPVVNIVIDGARAYVTTAGDGANYGFMFAFDINVSNGAVTVVGSKALGLSPGVAGVDPLTGDIFQVVSRANCSEGDAAVPYVIRITPDEMTWDAI